MNDLISRETAYSRGKAEGMKQTQQCAAKQQTTKKILDACCGGRMFYFDKSDQRVLFCDNRTVETELCDGRKFIVRPDIQCDFASLPFEDGSFKLVVFDPPHLLRNTGKSKMDDMYGSLNERATPTGYQQIKYGALYSDWKDMLRRGFLSVFGF